MNVYIVPGYHLPKDINNDQTYMKYFDYVCIEIKKISNDEKVLIVLSGGNIDMDEPFDKILSKEMMKLFEKYKTKYNLNCLIKTEEKSLSSLENLLYSRDIIDEFNDKNEIYIFSDTQRLSRMKVLADNVFDNPKMLGIDLSQSEEKQNADTVNKKEELATKFSLWALRSEKNFEKFRNIYSEKYAYLRTIPPENRKSAEIEWWKKMIANSLDTLSIEN